MADIKFGIDIVASVDKSTNALGKLGKASKKMGGKVAGLAKNLLGSKLSLLALVATVGIAIKNFAQLETKVTNVTNLFGGSKEDVKAYTEQLLEMSTRVPQGVNNLADALFQVVSAGVDAGESIAFLETASKLAVAGVTDTKTAVDGLTSVINAYGLEASDAARVSDIFFAAQVEGKTTIAELSKSIGVLAPAAQAAGIKVEEMFAAVTTLTKGGINTKMAVTSLRGAINSILKPTDQAMQKAKELGIDFSASALKTKGLTGVLEDMKVATGGNADELAVLIPNVRALTGVLALTGKQSEEFIRVQGEISNSVGVTKAAYTEMSHTMGAQFKILLNNFKKLGHESVGVFAPMLVDSLTWINENFNNIVHLIRKSMLIIIGEMKISAAAIQTLFEKPFSFSTYKDLFILMMDRIAKVSRVLQNLLKKIWDEGPKAIKDAMAEITGIASDGEMTLKDKILKIKAETNAKIEKLEKDRLLKLKASLVKKINYEETANKAIESNLKKTIKEKYTLKQLGFTEALKLFDNYNNNIVDMMKDAHASEEELVGKTEDEKNKIRERAAKAQAKIQSNVAKAMTKAWDNEWDTQLDIMGNFVNNMKNLIKQMAYDYLDGLKIAVIAQTAKDVSAAVGAKNFVHAGIVTAQGAAAVTAIGAARGMISGLADGGIVTGNGIYELAEKNKKEAVIPLENPKSERLLQGLGGGGGTANVNFYLEGRALDTFTEVLDNNKTKLKKQGRI